MVHDLVNPITGRLVSDRWRVYISRDTVATNDSGLETLYWGDESQMGPLLLLAYYARLYAGHNMSATLPIVQRAIKASGRDFYLWRASLIDQRAGEVGLARALTWAAYGVPLIDRPKLTRAS